MEGEDLPQLTPLDQTAFHIAGLVANGRGGVDWSAVPFLASYFGVTDAEGLMERLITIVSYRPPRSPHGHRHPVD